MGQNHRASKRPITPPPSIEPTNPPVRAEFWNINEGEVIKVKTKSAVALKIVEEKVKEEGMMHGAVALHYKEDAIEALKAHHKKELVEAGDQGFNESMKDSADAFMPVKARLYQAGHFRGLTAAGIPKVDVLRTDVHVSKDFFGVANAEGEEEEEDEDDSSEEAEVLEDQKQQVAPTDSDRDGSLGA